MTAKAKEIRQKFLILIDELCFILGERPSEDKERFLKKYAQGLCKCNRPLVMNSHTGKLYLRCVRCRKRQAELAKLRNIKRKGLAL